MKVPVLSVCIPTYNRANTIKQCVEKLLQYDGDEIEIVVCDDCSNDNTLEILAAIDDKRLRFFENDMNLGASYNSHTCFMKAFGKYSLLISDEDDLDLNAIKGLINELKLTNRYSVYLVSGSRGPNDKLIYPDRVYKKGWDALYDLGFNIRYMTGVIFRTDLYKDKIEIYGKRERNNMSTLMYYSDAVNEELNSISSIPKNLIKSGGIKIYTTLDVNAQKKLDDSIKENGSNEDDVQLAGILVNPKTGGVLALAGGKNYARSQYNRVTQSKRQVGSTIKPFLYYSALENNMTESSRFYSSKVSFVFGNKETYTPNNYSNLYANKEITMAAALAYSDNIYAVKTHLFLGEEQLVKTMKMAGLKEKLNPVPSLALGSQELNMLDYANSYVTLANYGTTNETYFIERVEDVNGNLLYKHKEKSKEVFNKDSVFIINEMMTNTYNPAFIDYLNPTIIYLNSKISRKYAIKSGTTDNDYWIVGYNPDALMMVWAGNDMNKNVNSVYSKKIKNIWCDTIEEYLKDKETSWYEPSDNIIGIPLDAVSGDTPKSSKNTVIYYYKKGTEN